MKKGGVSTGNLVAIGAGLAALGAGAYYLLGPDGKKHQQKAAAWMSKMEKEAMKKLSAIKEVTKPVYNNIVDTLAENYSKQYKEHAAQIKSFAEHMKAEWKTAAAEAKPMAKRAVSKAKKTVKQAVKDAVK